MLYIAEKKISVGIKQVKYKINKSKKSKIGIGLDR